MIDAISRSTLLETLDTLIKIAQQNENDDAEHVMVVAASCVKGAPALDVQPVVHGEWIHDEELNTYCSACESYIPTVHCHQTYQDGDDFDWDEEIELTQFCPNCGARMDGK